MMLRRGLISVSVLLSLAACDNAAPSPEAKQKGIEKTKRSTDAIAQVEGQTLGTPMAERLAVIGLLNKRNGQTRVIELKPGEALRIGKVVVRVRACERTAPWENSPDQGAFVQLLAYERPPGTNDSERWRSVFSGWLFKENPVANVVQHPIYDVWVKECRMSFPGEEDALEKIPAAGEVVEPAAAPKAAVEPDKPAAKKPSNEAQPSRRPAPPVINEPEEEVVEEGTVET